MKISRFINPLALEYICNRLVCRKPFNYYVNFTMIFFIIPYSRVKPVKHSIMLVLINFNKHGGVNIPLFFNRY